MNVGVKGYLETGEKHGWWIGPVQYNTVQYSTVQDNIVQYKECCRPGTTIKVMVSRAMPPPHDKVRGQSLFWPPILRLIAGHLI